jgi:TonB family protein
VNADTHALASEATMETARTSSWPAVAIWVLFAGLTPAANAQVVVGVLRDASSGRPAPALWVAVRPQGERRFVGGVRADSTGRFALATPAVGLYHLEISLPDGTRQLVDSVGATGTPDRPLEFLVPLAEAEARRMYFDFQVERKARVRRSVRPSYPSEAAARGIQGEVFVQVAVDSMGVPVPETLRVLRSPDESLAAAVKAVVLQWRFEPARLRGRPVRQMVQIPFNFSVP